MRIDVAASHHPSTTGATRLDVPAGLTAELTGAVAAGRAEAASWAAANPAGNEASFAADTTRSITAPPTGDAAAADLARVRAAQATRTPEGIALARIHQAQTGWDTWSRALAEIRSTEGAAQALRAERLVRQSQQRTDAITDAAKVRYDRRRPYQVDHSITTVVNRPDGNPSYPSGHASGAYAAAVVLAALLPARADELLDAAAQVAYSRVYAGVHFPSDVVAGARIAARIAADVLRRAGVPVRAGSPVAA